LGLDVIPAEPATAELPGLLCGLLQPEAIAAPASAQANPIAHQRGTLAAVCVDLMATFLT
jgi:hypothetical protein